MKIKKLFILTFLPTLFLFPRISSAYEGADLDSLFISFQNILKEFTILVAKNNLAAVSATSFTPNIPTTEGLSLAGDTTFGELNVKENSQGVSGLAYGNWGSSMPSCKNVITTTPYGTNALEVSYPGNDFGNGVGGCWIEGTLGQKWTKMYFSMSVWVPTNYSMHSNAEKFLYMHTTADGDPTLQGTLIEWYPYGSGETPNGPTFGLELNPNTASGVMYPNPYGGGPWYWIYQNIGSQRIQKGVWQNIEVYLQMNTPGQQNGVYKVWIEGNKVLEGTNALFRGGTTQGYFNGIRFDGTRGGGVSNTPTPVGGQVRRYGRLAWYAYGGTITPPMVTISPAVTPFPIITTPTPIPTPTPESTPLPVVVAPTPTPKPELTPEPVLVPSTTTYILTKTLSRGSRGTQVTTLQTILNVLGYLTETPTGYFGINTENAVKAFQKEKNIVSSGNRWSTGYGVVGSKTRVALLNAVGQ